MLQMQQLKNKSLGPEMSYLTLARIQAHGYIYLAAKKSAKRSPVVYLGRRTQSYKENVFFFLFPYNISLNNISVPFIAFSVKHTSNPELDHVSTSLFLVSAFLKVTSAFYSSSFYFIVYSLSCSFIKFRISLIYYNPIPTNIFYLFFKLLSH